MLGMYRRTFLGGLGASVMTAGCAEVDTQPESVPVRLDNQAGQQLAVAVRFRDDAGGETLVSTTVTVDAGTEESVYAKPIQNGVEYSLSVVIEETETEQTISGGGFRNIQVNIYSPTRVEISRVDT
jgi:hypothetical protein